MKQNISHRHPRLILLPPQNSPINHETSPRSHICNPALHPSQNFLIPSNKLQSLASLTTQNIHNVAQKSSDRMASPLNIQTSSLHQYKYASYLPTAVFSTCIRVVRPCKLGCSCKLDLLLRECFSVCRIGV